MRRWISGGCYYLWIVPARFRVLNTPKGENELEEGDAGVGGVTIDADDKSGEPGRDGTDVFGVSASLEPW